MTIPPIDLFKSDEQIRIYLETHEDNLSCEICKKKIEQCKIRNLEPQYWSDRRFIGDGKWQKLFYFCSANHSLLWHESIYKKKDILV